jgi:hypothetical protein
MGREWAVPQCSELVHFSSNSLPGIHSSLTCPARPNALTPRLHSSRAPAKEESEGSTTCPTAHYPNTTTPTPKSMLGCSDFNLDHSVDHNADYCYNSERHAGEDSLLYGLQEETTTALTAYPASCASSPATSVASPELASSRSGSLSFSRSSSFSVPGLAPTASPSLADVFLRGPSAEKDALQQYLNGLAATMTGKRQRDEDEKKDKKKRKRRTTKRAKRPATTSGRKGKAEPAPISNPALTPAANPVLPYASSIAPVPAPSPLVAPSPPAHYYTNVFFDAPASCLTQDDDFWNDVEDVLPSLHSEYLEASSLRDAFFNSSFGELERFLLEHEY